MTDILVLPQAMAINTIMLCCRGRSTFLRIQHEYRNYINIVLEHRSKIIRLVTDTQYLFIHRSTLCRQTRVVRPRHSPCLGQ